MRTRSSNNRFEVFEFSGDDERIEKASKKLLKRFGNPKSDDSALSKYEFLQCFSQGTKTQQKDFSNKPVDVDACDATLKERISRSVSSNNKPKNSNAARAVNLGVTSAGSKHLDSTLPQFPSDNEPVGINSGDDDSIELRSSSISASEPAENEGPLEEQELEHGFGGCDIDTIVVSPDYIIYGDMFCTKPLLTFSCSCIKLEGSAVYGIKGPFSFEWTIGDIVKIESQWCGRVGTAIVNLCLKSKDTKEAESADKATGIVELKFAVYDSHWSEKQEAIKSLDVRYEAIWNVVFDIDTARKEDACLGQSNISKHYFFNFDESFEEVIYPKGDPDAVSISKRDIELLQPDTFINDTIIDFYIKYLKNKIEPDEKHRFHFFNSFFFRKLADLDKDPSRACEGRAAFQRVHKWTRKVNLFEKDYIFIPVNFSLHWSLIVICHPGEVTNFTDEEMEKSLKVPCILHMDSIKGSHRGLKNLIQSYLGEEWKERQSEPVEDVSSKFLNLRFVPVELPQQENSFDCGLFLLHYVELFLEKAPVNFSPFRITKFSNFLSKDWFPPAEASLKRGHIKNLIYEIVEDNSQKVPQATCKDNYPPPKLRNINEKDTSIEFLREMCNSTETCHGNYCSSNADQEIEITQLPASPLRGVQCCGESELSLRGLIEPGATAGSHTDGSYQPLAPKVSLDRFKNVMSPIEEGEESAEQIAYSPTEEAGGQQMVEITEPSKTLYSAKDFRALETSGFSMHLEEHEDEDSSFGTSAAEDDLISFEVGANEDHPREELLGSNPEGEREKSESSSMSSDGLAACVVEDSGDANGTDDVNETENSPSSEEKIRAPSNQEAQSMRNTDLKANNMSAVSESEQQAAKRQRLMPPEGAKLTRGPSKDLH